MDNDLRFWRVNYKGLWLGGVAIVAAKSASDAIEIVRSDAATKNFKEYGAVLIPLDGGVLYNDNGDY